MRHIDTIIIHCTATRPNWWEGKSAQQKTDEVRRWHVEDRGWSDIGYHYLIDRDGTLVEGRPLERTGAHAKGHNTGSVGISLFGGHGGNVSDQCEDNFTEDQDLALRELIAKLKADHPITKIIGHNEVANKACPTFVVRDWLAKAPAVSQAPMVRIYNPLGIYDRIGNRFVKCNHRKDCSQMVGGIFKEIRGYFNGWCCACLQINCPIPPRQ